MKQTAVYHIPNEDYRNDDSGFIKYVTDNLTRDLAESVMAVLDLEGEIILKKPELRVRSVDAYHAVEYREEMVWEPLVRCKDCIHYWKNWRDGDFSSRGDDDVAVCLGSPRDDAFCSEGERREE